MTRCSESRSEKRFQPAGPRRGGPTRCRTLHPGERIYTFWDYFRNAYGRDAGLRLDHLLLSPSVASRLKAGSVDREVRGWEKASDHAPVWIELADRADTAAEPNRPAHPGATEGHARRSGRSPISAQNHWPGSFVILGRSATPIAGAAQALNSVVTIRTLSTLAPSR